MATDDPRFTQALLSDPRFATSVSGARSTKVGRASTAAAPAGRGAPDERFARSFDDADAGGAPASRKRQRAGRSRAGGARTVGDGGSAGAGNEGGDDNDYARAIAADAFALDAGGGDALAAAAANAFRGKPQAETVHERLARLSQMSRGEYALSSSSDDDEDDEGEGDVNGGDGGASATAREGRGGEDDVELGQELDEASRMARELDGPTVVQDPDAPDLEGNVEYSTLDGEETTRLALVNCDWAQLRAVDILATLQSFVPQGRALLRVAVYPSEYGLRRQAEERRFGPRNVLKGDLAPAHAPAASSSSSSSSSSFLSSSSSSSTSALTVAAVNSAKAVRGGTRRGAGAVDIGSGRRRLGRNGDGDEEGSEGDEFDPEKLRQYELNKMKHYFAVATFDSAAAAAAVYSACDGLEFESSSNVLDLRFVPDAQTFPHAPRDEATLVPDDYAPPVFATQALQSSKVDLTWDGDDALRSRALDWERIKSREHEAGGGGGGKRANAMKSDQKQQQRRGAGDADELGDLKNYLASSESEGDEDENGRRAKGASGKAKERARLRSLLLGKKAKPAAVSAPAQGGAEDSREDAQLDEDSEDENDEDEAEGNSEGGHMSITFTPSAAGGAKDVLAAKAEREAREKETAWDSYLRKRRERHKAKKDARKQKGAASVQAHQIELAATLREDTIFEGAPGAGRRAQGSLPAGGAREYGAEDDDETAATSATDPGAGSRRRAQLELLAVGEDDSGGSDVGGDAGTGTSAGAGISANFSLRSLVKAQKVADRIGRRAAAGGALRGLVPAVAASTSVGTGAGFEVDVADARFSAVFSAARPDFSIDPTAAQFKDTHGMRRILAHRRDTAGVGLGGGGGGEARPLVLVRAAGAAAGVAVGSGAQAAAGPEPASLSGGGAEDVRALAARAKARSKS